MRNRPHLLQKYTAIAAILSILLGAISAVANEAFAQASNSPAAPSAQHDAHEGPPALDFFASGLPQNRFACNERSGHVCSVLFVGDSYTHGRYTPVRTFNAQIPGQPWAPPQVIDENFGQTGDRQESPAESGPWGGIPGIFTELAQQMYLSYEVHIEAISATSLAKNYNAASDVIERAGWQAVVLQELSAKPLPRSLTNSQLSNPPAFWASVQTIEQAVHAVAPKAQVFLYGTWVAANLAKAIAGDTSQPDFDEKYMSALDHLLDTNLASYRCAAQLDGKVAGVAPVGEAWRRAWNDGLANPDPFQSSPSALPLLWYGINPVNDPPIKNPDYTHPSVYGAYLSGLVLFVEMTGADVRKLGAREQAAAELGIPGRLASRLQREAWLAVKEFPLTWAGITRDPCDLVGTGD
ncbi:MAG TPA: hypothetical protein VJN94_02300 [Candidatus Binataceae bacterium]|nr:hypothetical protein [Candidatus Binataceae bacterium]